MTDQIAEQLQSSKMPDDHLLKVVDLGPAPPASKKTDGNTAFLRAARSGNLEKVLEFINANVDINTSNANGLNALHLASKDGHAEVVVELLKRGADVDAATKKGNTALHIASLAGQEEVVKLLIEHGASVNVQSQSGFTPLYMAAQENHERVVRFLLNHGANQNLATEDGFTPLAVAMQQGNDKVVTELLENDTRGKIRLPALHIAAKKDDCKAAALLLQSEHNPDITSKSGFTPLHIASHYGNDAIASLLLAKGADVNYAAKHNITPLHVAAKWGRNNMVILLLDKGACITAKTRDGLTPLHCAARSGHEQVVDTLLQRHAPITAKTKNGLAPLHMASQGDHVEAARVLLSHRAPVDDVTIDYLTALHVASHCGHVSVAKLLLDRKADPNARALNGFTPLHIACKKNRVKIVELLLKHGAFIEATTESGLSPLHVASFMGCMNIVIYLLQCEANPDVSTIRGETPLHLASRANQTDIIRILLRNGAQVDAKAREQQTPLHIASRLGNTDIVMLLLQHGASVDSVTKDLYTPLHIAAKEDQEEVAQTLLENNATLTATTKKGFTPLHLAAKHGRTKIATLLLQRGAPVDAQGKNGVTPLHVASHYDHQGIALQLLDKGASPHATAKNGHTPLHIAAKKNQMDIAAMLLEYGADADIESKAGFTPLHLAAQEGHADMTNLLLEHKADVNHSSKNGLTPLHLCAQEDCVEVAKILVKNGADVNAVTKAAYTPLHIASHFGQLNMVRFLLSQKAKVDMVTSKGYTPLHQAAQQGNSAIVAVLLDNGASPETKNNQGQTALYIAQKLGYISVVEVLKNVTEGGKGSASAVSGSEEKYKVVAPETMQENFMSDSEDEGGDDAINESSYRYLTIDEMKSLGDDSLPLDITKEDRYDTTAGVDESISPQHTYNQLSAAPSVPDNVDVTRAPTIQTGFLVSFLVDAKGGAMRGCRHSGVRVIVPPQSVTMPTRVTCRYVRRDKPNHPPPPPLMEGEALSSRILELGPVGVKFLGPVVIEVPNFAALRGNEREIVILRSDNGETWREHTVDSSPEVVQEILSRSFDKDGNQIQLDEPGRITAIVTSDFPHYFAIVSRIRQEVHAIGPEGGMVSSSVVPQVQAVFPQGALTKKIKVGLQAQPIPSELTAAILGNCVAVSPIVTIEPRRRKFHKPITLTLPVPQAANKGMINQYSGDAPTLRLLCSITGGTSRAQWEDVTGSTPLTFVKECVSFTTTVSARFWLMDIRDIAMATKKATELYREAIHIPFMAKFVVFAKRIDNNEARLRVFCMTDDKEDKTLECQEHFTEVAKSRDVEVLEGKKQLIELSGNLISVTKSGEQLKLGFNAFHENRLPFTVRIKDSLADPIGRMLFFKEQKPVKTSTPHPPICVLNIVLPEGIVPDPEFLDSPMLKYNFLNDTQDYHRSEVRFSDISNLIGEDWIPLSEKLGISSDDVNVIKSEYPESVAKQALTMLRIWHQQAGSKASPNILENALLSIGRQDIVQECILNTTEQQKKRKHVENEAYSKEVISEVIEDYQVDKKKTYTTDDDEKKYTAEEKAIDEHESKKSVSERKMEIERRLLGEPTSKSSTEHYENEEKQQLPDRETEVIKRQKPEQLDIVKSVVYDHKEEIEPTSLTFQQKRLSFERGLSVDKILSEQIVDSVSTKEEKLLEKPKTEKKEDRIIMHINKEKIKKDDKLLLTDAENFEFEKKIVEKTPTGGSDTFINEERTLSFSEKRLSFEQADVTKMPQTQSEIKAAEKTEVPKRSVEDTRRDSELFESVSDGLRKLDTQPSPAVDQCYLSPKPVKTPPPSPAEFKVHDLQKNDSVDSNKSGKSISDEDPDLKSENTSELKTASLETLDTPASQFVKISPDEILQLHCDTDITPPAITASYAELIKSESVCEIMHEDGNAYYEEKDNLGVTIEPIQLTTLDGEITTPVVEVNNFNPLQEENFTELIDRLIEQENAKLLASGQLSYESDADSSTEEEIDLKAHRYVSEPSESTNVINGKPENCKAEDEYTNSEKLHQRKVAFRLNSAEDDLVYPGQTDSEECSSSSENCSEELIDNIVKEKLSIDGVQEEDSLVNNDEIPSLELHSNFQPFTEIERKFERMASETLEEESEKMAEGEFHRIVSQLSLEEVDDCLNAWNEAEVVVGNEKAVQLQGNIEQHSYTTSETSLVQSQANLDNITKNKSEECDNMNYVSKKKFWQSFESTGSECKPTPVPKPRASICTTGIRDDTPPVASKRSFENICSLASKDVIKSESADNIVAAYSRSLSKPTMKQMHSLTAYSTDSEAEYIASCGIEKLAYENIAFSEEEEDRSLDISSVDGGVKAKKMFFEQMQKESSTSQEDSMISPPSSTKIVTKINKFEEHFDKSEMEATEKKENHVENVVNQKVAIPIDVTTTMNICSIENDVRVAGNESVITTFLKGVTNTEIANEKVDIKVEDNVRSAEDVHRESYNENGHENKLFANASVLSEEHTESYYMENVSEENTKSEMISKSITSVAKEPHSDFTDEVHIRFSYEEVGVSSEGPDIKTAEHSENETKNKIKEVSMQLRNNSSNETEPTKLETLPVEKESEQEQNIITKISVPESPFDSFGNEGTIIENISMPETSHICSEQKPFATQVESVNKEIEKSQGKSVAESKIPISKCSAADKIASLKRETGPKELESNQTGLLINKTSDNKKNVQKDIGAKMVETVTVESSKNVEEEGCIRLPSENNNELANVDGIILQSGSNRHFSKCEDESSSVITKSSKMEYYSDVEDLKTTDFEILTSDETNISDSFCIKTPKVTCIIQPEIQSTLSEQISSDDNHVQTKASDVTKLKFCENDRENESFKEFRTEDEMEPIITKVKKSKIPVLSSHIETISQPFTVCFHEKEGAISNKTLDKCKTQASFEKPVKDSSSVVMETVSDRLKSSAVAKSEAIDGKPVITETVFNKSVFLEGTETLTNTMVDHMSLCKSEPPVTKTVVTETVDSETAADIEITDTKSSNLAFSTVSGQSATNRSPIISEKISTKFESVVASEKSFVTDTVSTESIESKSIIFEKPASITCTMLTETVSGRDDTQATSQSELPFMSNMKVTDIECSESKLSTVSEKLLPTNTMVIETILTQSKPQNVSNLDDSMKKEIKFDKYESSEDMKSTAYTKENISNISTAEITEATARKSESVAGKPAVIDTTITKTNFNANKLQNIFEKPIEIASKLITETTSNVYEYQILPENITVASSMEGEITSHKSEPIVEKSADIFTAETVFHHESELSVTREEPAKEMVLTESTFSKSECSAIPCKSSVPHKLTSSIPSVSETQRDNSVVIVERTSAEEKYNVKEADGKFRFESPSSDASSKATSTRIFLDNEIIDEIDKEQTEFIQLNESSHVTDISDKQIVVYDSSNKRILISEDEAKIVAENLVMEIETEINKRPDIIENLLLLRHADLLRAASGDPSDDISNDITDEDLRSTGTEVDLPVAEDHEFHQKNEICDRLGKNVLFAETAVNIGEASPTEYEITYEQAEEFSVLESVDFADQLLPLEVDSDIKSVNKPSKPQLSGIHAQSEMERKNSDESGARNDILSPESGTSDSARRCEDIIRCSRGCKSTADMEPCSSSSESHYLSFTSDNRTTGSRPCSSDIEGLLSNVLPGTTGSSEYDTAVSQDTTSFYSHDFYTAVSSASLQESLKSIESESSGHQGSAEVSSEISETLVPSSAELEHDIDIPVHGIVFENNRRLLCRKSPLEPYDQDIPVNVIRAASSSIKTSQTKTATYAPISIKDFSDDKMISSNEDTSSISTTDGATLPTMFEVASNESDRLDNSLISEQSLTMSSASYQFDAKENTDVDHKVVDTNTFITSSPNIHKTLPTITMITSTTHDEGRQHVCTQMTSKVENLLSSRNESPAAISPESESFELVEKPDLLDDFVVIEEVAKEACEEDEEGKGIRIIMKRKSKSYDEEEIPPPKTNSTLTQVKYYGSGGTPEDGYNFEGVTFEQEKQSPDEELYESSPPNDNLYEHEVEEGKKWIERQFQTDSEVASEYEYTFERVPLEDIKEEDTDDMQSSKVGSVSSQISQSVGSLGSMKQSLSSTPDYDILAGKRYFSKPTEPDTISQASLQEFERLEQLIALESMKGKLSGSQDSIASSSNGSDKKRSGDDISVSSLKVFEGLEYACVEAEKIEERAKAEERSLSQIEEGHESQASESESCETLEKSQYESDEDENDYDRKMFEIDEIIRQAQSNVEQFVNVDHLEKTESLGRGDSFEETSRIPDFELDRPLTDINCSKKYIENVDVSRSLTTSTDSLELKHAVHFEDTLFTSTDSLEAKVRHDVASDSLDSDRQEDECRANTISDRSCISEKGGDFLADDMEQPCRFSPNQISSPDSGEATSSATTHATYQNEADSVMSSSFTSGGSNTMISSTENLENIISGYSNWLDGSQSYVTEVVETVSEDKNYRTTHHTVEIAGDGMKTIGYQGPDARTLMQRDIADFKPGEYCSETEEIDADGTVRISRIVEMRTIVSSEQVESLQKFTFGGRSSSSGDGISDMQIVSHTLSNRAQPGGDRAGNTVADDVLTEKKSEIAGETATDQKKPH